MSPVHPGTITFVEGTTETTELAQNVPESLRFAPDATGALVAVVRVVAVTSEHQRVIREYAADGAELRSTLQKR